MRESAVYILGAGCISAVGRGLLAHKGGDALSDVSPVPVPESLFETRLSHPVFVVQGPELSDSAARLVAGSSFGAGLYRLNRTEKFFLTSVCEALENAGLSPPDIKNMRVGIAAGTTVGSTFTDHVGYNAWKQGRPINTSRVEDYFCGNLARLVHSVLGTSGPAAVIVNACSSGTDAIGLAAAWLRQGLCDIALAGGADELSVIPYHGFSSLQLLDDNPCRPFDVSRAGLNLGEGAACMVLARGNSGSMRFAKDPIGLILSYGAASDAWHPTAPHPEGRGLSAALTHALHRGGLGISDISFINAHGTGTVANDLAETAALFSLFDNDVPPVVSTKGATGHTLGAAGAIEAVLSLLTLSEGVAHGTRGCTEPDPALRVPVLKSGDRTRLSGMVGISQSLAFGGGNSVLVVEALGHITEDPEGGSW